jgi:hypothetical protein
MILLEKAFSMMKQTLAYSSSDISGKKIDAKKFPAQFGLGNLTISYYAVLVESDMKTRPVHLNSWKNEIFE